MLCGLCSVSCSRPQSFVEKWPQIKEISARHHFVDHKDEVFQLTIRDKNERSLYCLDVRLNAGGPEDVDYNFSGVVDCRLYTADRSKSIYPTILQNRVNASADWQTNGRFLIDELTGLEGAPPSRSMVQRCKVCGMSIAIQINNVKNLRQKDGVGELDLFVDFKNDPSALEEICINQPSE